MQNDIQIILYQLSSGSGMISTFYTSLGSSSSLDLMVSELLYIFGSSPGWVMIRHCSIILCTGCLFSQFGLLV